MMSVYGEVGRVFIQRIGRHHGKQKSKVKKKRERWGKGAKEGWVEFQNKAIAKRVSAILHNTPMVNRKRSRFHDDLWNIKYLHRFKWTHLNERLGYEKLVRQQKIRAEVSQAKRVTNFFLQNVEKSKSLKKRKKRQEWEEKSWHFCQRATEAEIQASKAASHSRALECEKAAELHRKSQSNVSLLAKIFSSTMAQK